MENSERLQETVFLNGDIYYGNFRGTVPHGKGKYMWSDGTVFEGDWEEGNMTGKGQIFWSSGATYEGDFSVGYLHGFGTYRHDGSIYTGSWRMNIQHGLGRKQYSNLDTYEGSWKEGMHEGTGKYSWNFGNTYIGNWKAGKMCGRGVMKWNNGELYDGFWQDGLRHGSGFYRFGDGGYYFGTWTRGLKDGKGTFYLNGDKHPSLTYLSSSARCDDKGSVLSQSPSLNLEENRAPKPGVKRSLSEKISMGGFLKSSGRISNRTTSHDADWKRCDSDISCVLSHTSGEDEREVQDNSTLVYEREYMQGVLIKEKANYVNMSQKSRQQSTLHVGEVKSSSWLDIFGGRRSYYLMLNLQLGIRYTVGKITPVPMREVRSSDFGDRARIRMYFPRKGSQFTPPHHSIDFYWKDYCPMVFRNLRELFMLDAAEYMMSICGADGLREISSSGKSGSIFYLSHDDRFVIKTLKKSEVKALLKMLPKYYTHVREHENTLITKFFGLHRITLKGGQQVRFVVMGNMFCTELRIHRRYDLKGSTLGRYTNQCDIRDTTTLKDLDLSYIFRMDKLLRRSLLKQISLDCMFLESQQIIDYSLLLGLHFRAPEHLQNCERTPAATGAASQMESLVPPNGLLLVTHEPSFANTLRGPHIRGSTLRALSVGDQEVDLLVPGTGRLPVHLGVNMPAQATRRLMQDEVDSSKVELFEVYDVVLYLGIIDVLQEYNMKKKIEHAYKSLRFDPASISVVDPETYSNRFFNYLEKVFPDQP